MGKNFNFTLSFSICWLVDFVGKCFHLEVMSKYEGEGRKLEYPELLPDEIFEWILGVYK